MKSIVSNTGYLLLKAIINMVLDQEITQKLLRDYKFSNVPLESVVKQLFVVFGIGTSCLGRKDCIDIIAELSFLLVDYKFNKLNYSQSTLVSKVDSWLTLNKPKLLSSNWSSWGL